MGSIIPYIMENKKLFETTTNQIFYSPLIVDLTI